MVITDKHSTATRVCTGVPAQGEDFVNNISRQAVIIWSRDSVYSICTSGSPGH